jgi:hypothetical protein
MTVTSRHPAQDTPRHCRENSAAKHRRRGLLFPRRDKKFSQNSNRERRFSINGYINQSIQT